MNQYSSYLTWYLLISKSLQKFMQDFDDYLLIRAVYSGSCLALQILSPPEVANMVSSHV